MFYIILSIAIILVLIYIIFFYKKTNEQFGDPLSDKKINETDMYDISKQFEDVIVYDNLPNGRIGYDRCIEKCHGYCVENGQTGSAYCYPVHQPKIKDFNGMVVQNDQKLSFPNVN